MSGLQIALLVFALAVVGVLAYLFRRNTPDAGSDSAPMPAASRLLLVSYLLVSGVLLAAGLILLFSVDVPDIAALPQTAAVSGVPTAPVSPSSVSSSPAGLAAKTASSAHGNAAVGRAATPTQGTAPAEGGQAVAVQHVQNEMPAPQPGDRVADVATTDNATPVVLGVFHHLDTGDPATLVLAISGRHFTQAARVRINHVERAKKYFGPELLEATPLTADLTGVGAITVDVVDADRTSNAVTVRLDRPRAFLLPGSLPITREVQLLLIVLLAGALGSHIHGLQSLADFVGNRTLTASWFWWYITRPFIGMAMALVFYAVLRGGFLAGTPADGRLVNAFAVLAVAALVGMFSDTAALKLADVFDTLFKTADQRGGRLAAPVIDTLDPASVKVGAAGVVTIVGDRLGKATTVRLDREDHAPSMVSEKKLQFTLTPADVAQAGNRGVTVVSEDGSASPAKTLEVTV